MFYHFLSLEFGIEVFRKLGAKKTGAFWLSLFLVVTVFGLITESLNQQVHSWRVTSMPFTNFRIGNYYIVFQTIGYWLMALIPYALYEVVGLVSERYSEDSIEDTSTEL